MKYHTKNKTAILKFFEENSDRSISAEDVSRRLSISHASVYRIINELYRDGALMVAAEPGKKLSWQYADKEKCPKHMHIRCRVCGRIEHLDEESTERIRKIIFSETGFSATKSSVFEGVCPECED